MPGRVLGTGLWNELSTPQRVRATSRDSTGAGPRETMPGLDARVDPRTSKSNGTQIPGTARRSLVGPKSFQPSQQPWEGREMRTGCRQGPWRHNGNTLTDAQMLTLTYTCTHALSGCTNFTGSTLSWLGRALGSSPSSCHGSS